MRVVSSQARQRATPMQPSLSAGEAVAVLYELNHQAQARLLDCCQEFQDIAFDMEWRLREWQGLVDQRRWLQRDIERAHSPRARFNVDARKRAGLKPRDKAWQRHQQSLRAKLVQLEHKIAAATAGIIARNEEGAEIEAEITSLQKRCERIENGLRSVRKPRAHDDRSADAVAAAMARLIMELSAEPDVGDLANLVIAARVIDERMGSSTRD